MLKKTEKNNLEEEISLKKINNIEGYKQILYVKKYRNFIIISLLIFFFLIICISFLFFKLITKNYESKLKKYELLIQEKENEIKKMRKKILFPAYKPSIKFTTNFFTVLNL